MSYHPTLPRRNHSYDSQSPDRNPILSPRVSSLPRVNVNSYSSGSYASNYAVDTSPLYFSGLEHRSSSNLGGHQRSARSMMNTAADKALQRSLVSMTERSRQSRRHRDLKRKMVFDLHKEIKKPVHTFVLEEISDLDRITEICMDTLKSMMASRTHRKYLHHMNNNALTVTSDVTLARPLDVTNNHDSADPEGSVIGTEETLVDTMKRLRRESKELEQMAIHEQRRHSTRGPRMRADTPIDLTHLTSETREQRRQRQEAMIHLQKFRNKLPTDSINTLSSSATLRASGPPLLLSKDQEAKLRRHISASQSMMPLSHVLDNEDNLVSRSISSRISTSRSIVDQTPAPTAQNTMVAMSPVEALECKYLRLSEDQVQFLEDMVRASGKHPGIHAHSRVDINVVFEDLHQVKIDPMKRVIWPALNKVVEDEEMEDETSSIASSSRDSKKLTKR